MEANLITTTEYYELIKGGIQCKDFIGLVEKDLTNVKFDKKGSRSNLSEQKYYEIERELLR